MQATPQNVSSIKYTATWIPMLRNAVKKLVENAVRTNPQNASSIENTATWTLTLPNVVQKLVENAVSCHVNKVISSNCFYGYKEI